MGLAKNINRSITPDIKMALYFAVSKTLCSARSGCLAPRFWPTNVAAALLNPHAGKIKNTTFRNATWYPAEAAVPPVLATNAAKTIQLPEAFKNWKVAGHAIPINVFIKGQSNLKCLALI